MIINVEIEKLILNGFDYEDQNRINIALRQEMTRLIKENGLPKGFGNGHAIQQMYAPSFNASDGMNPRIIGSEIARSIYGAWKRTPQY